MTTLRRCAVATGAALAITFVLVGIPILMWWLGAPLLPNRFPDWTTVTGVLTRPDDGRLLLGFLVLIGVAAWALLALSIVLELIAAIGNRAVPRIELPGFRWSRVVAAVLVTALLGAGPASAAPAAAPSPALVALTISTPAETPAQQGRTYVVAPRDTLWRIAETELGDPLRWREILSLNAGTVQADGGRLVEATQLRVGWVLRLPTDDETGRTVVVRKGDTLSAIARDHLGSAGRTDELLIANSGVVQDDGDVLRDADEIRVGWRIVIPQTRDITTDSPDPAPAPPPAATPAAPTTGHTCALEPAGFRGRTAVGDGEPADTCGFPGPVTE